MKTNDEIPCNVTSDLMVLYVTGKTSPETKQIVEAHLRTCPACAQAFGLEAQAEEHASIPKAAKPAVSGTFLEKLKFSLYPMWGFLLFLVSRTLFTADRLLKRFSVSTTGLKIRLYRARRRVAGMTAPQTNTDAEPVKP